MTAMYLVFAIIVAWIVFKLFTKPRQNQLVQNDRKLENQIKITISCDTERSTNESHESYDNDAWEGSFWEVTQPHPAKTRLRINYVDGSGKKTERTVDVRQFGSFDSTTLLIGHCHMRDATRTFRSDRITSCIDEETGEIVSDVKAYLLKKYDESPDKTMDQLLEDEYDTLRVLLYVGKADGQLRAAEKAEIRETCVTITNDSRLTDETIAELLANMDVPSLQAFKLAVGRLAKKDKASKDIVMVAAERIVATQKTIHSAEQEALDYMKKRFTSEI